MSAAGVRWVTGSPLWPRADDAAMPRPALLRFGSDTFMDDLTAILQNRPADLAAAVATPRTFRAAPPGAPPGWPGPLDRLKLYQPLHGDFNLVAASLVCRTPGLPDRTVRPADAEQVAFVIRRIGAGNEAEFAWATDPADGSRRWLAVAAGREAGVADGEELFPLFPVNYCDGGQPRRVFVGLVPVTSRDTFAATTAVPAFPPRPDTGPAGVPDPDPRWEEFDTRVILPLVALRDPALPAAVTPEQRQEASAILLVEFADLLRRHLPAVWAALPGSGGPAWLGTAADNSRALTWRRALRDAWDQRLAILGESGADPALRCDVRFSAMPARLNDAGDAPGAASLQGAIRAALNATPDSAPVSDAAPVPKLEPSGTATYRVRCVYRRPKCCPFPIDLVSAPSDRFAIAPLFDPDAPARQIRISLPVDTSPKELRKYRKNVGFILSNQLRSQLDRITDPKKALDGELGEETRWDLGVICQLSIPIITICALVVMMIFLAVLNIVFFWMPFFRICLPVPLRSRP